MKNYVKYEYVKEEIGWGNYDIMFPQTPLKKEVSIKFETDAKLSLYFDEFIQFLLDVGFTNEEITNHLKSICNHKHEISIRV